MTSKTDEETPKNEEQNDEAEMQEENGKGTAEGDEPMKDAAGEEPGEPVQDEPTEDTPKEPEKPKELEEDAAEDLRARVPADSVAVNMADATINVLQTQNSNILMGLTEGGLQYLLASTRANAGIKAGRYMFEAKIIESLNPTEPQGGQKQTPMPKQLVRIGLSLAGSSVILGDSEASICFDCQGYHVHGKKRSKVAVKFNRGETVALLVNLDEKSPNANTISLFRNGQRVSEPQPLPDNLKGKVLYPTVSYKNVTLQLNLGNLPMAPLPFKCRMLGDAAQADVEVSKVTTAAPGGKCEVLFPVGLPDKGVFDWADHFLEKNPTFTELSDRKVLEWATKSGLWRPKAHAAKGSNDSPEFGFGVPLMDDLSARRVLDGIVPMLERNFLVTELQSNLVPDQRKKLLARFNAPHFKKVACVLMGEPNEDHKARIQELLLADKREAAEAERKKNAAAEERKKLFEEKKRKAEEAKRAREAAQKKKKAGGDDAEMEDKEEKEEAADAGDTAEKDESKLEEDKPVELTEEEKKSWVRASALPDISQVALSKSFSSFALPTQEEGFDEVRFLWQPKETCEQELQSFVLGLKKTQKVEDLKLCDWFKTEFGKWSKVLTEWKRKQTEWKDPAKRKAMLQKKKEEEKKKKEEEKEEDGEAKEEEEEKAAMEINAEDVDVFSVEDVTDLGNGEPLFSNFTYEDWVLLTLRAEMHLMLHAFRMTLNDPDRPTFHEMHLSYYYPKYFRKNFALKNYGAESVSDFCKMIEDVAVVQDSGMIEVVTKEDTDFNNFMKHTEECRRERQRRVDAGDETAKLKFLRSAPQPPKQPGAPAATGGSGTQRASQGSSSQRMGSYGSSATSGYGAQKRPYSAGPPQSQSAYASKRPRQAYGSSGSYGGGYGGSYGRR